MQKKWMIKEFNTHSTYDSTIRKAWPPGQSPPKKTKRNLMVLIDHIIKYGYDSNKDMNEMFRELHAIDVSDKRTENIPKSPMKRKPKWSLKEF